MAVNPEAANLQLEEVLPAPGPGTARRARTAHFGSKRGPVGLWLQSLGRAGAITTRQLQVVQRAEAVINVLTDPIQRLKKDMVEMGGRAAVRAAAVDRVSMQGGSEIDAHITNKLDAELSEEHRALLMGIKAGGIWTAQDLYRAQVLPSPICRSCGQEVETKWHLWWECAAHEPCREELRLLCPELQPVDLPNVLALHGVAPAMGVAVERAYWGNASSRHRMGGRSPLGGRCRRPPAHRDQLAPRTAPRGGQQALQHDPPADCPHQGALCSFPRP